MTREAELQLLEFCARQRENFSPPEWRHFDSVTKDTLATAALFLAGVDWYGQEEHLSRVAARLRPDCVGNFSAMVKRCNFDCARFSSMLKMRLRHEHALA